MIVEDNEECQNFCHLYSPSFSNVFRMQGLLEVKVRDVLLTSSHVRLRLPHILQSF